MAALFLSHSSRDGERSREIAAWLREQGFESLFLDEDPEAGLVGGRQWERQLYARLRQCRAVVVLCSEHSLASRWCFAEVTQARALGKALVPVRISAAVPVVPDILRELQVVDLATPTPAGWQRLKAALDELLGPRDTLRWDGSRPPYPGLLALRRDRRAWRLIEPFRPLRDPFAELARSLRRAARRRRKRRHDAARHRPVRGTAGRRHAGRCGLQRLADRVVKARLLVAGAHEGARTVEVAHEAIFRAWRQLADWIAEHRALLRLREAVRRAAGDWQANRDDAGLLVHRGSRLEDAEALLTHPAIALSSDERDYLGACLAERERERRAESERLGAIAEAELYASLLMLAQQYVERGQYELALAALADCPPARRH